MLRLKISYYGKQGKKGCVFEEEDTKSKANDKQSDDNDAKAAAKEVKDAKKDDPKKEDTKKEDAKKADPKSKEQKGGKEFREFFVDELKEYPLG